MSNLVEHAKKELALLGEDEEMVVKPILEMLEIFSNMSHSGYSAAYTVQLLSELLSFKNLGPLTNDPEEWFFYHEDIWGGKGGVWQNIRNSEAFSHNEGRSYYLLSEGGNDKHREPKHIAQNGKRGYWIENPIRERNKPYVFELYTKEQNLV